MNTVPDILKASQEPIDNVIATVGQLSQAASKMPYYKFNNMWSRQMQNAVCRVCLYSIYITDSITGRRPSLLGWLGGYKYDGGEIKAGRLLTIEELGEILKSALSPAYHAFLTNIRSPGQPQGA